jgi:hypothetical protein
MRKSIGYLLAGALTVIMFPMTCFAQFGAIAGIVKDESGAVLPGVSVEAVSPVLIEKTRTAVSDSAGQYKVEQLRPGLYTVTFTLPGFGSIRREGIEISAGFTAPVNVSLKVSAVAETVTVLGQTPVVDVQSVSQQKTLGKEALEALPTGRSFATVGTTLPGVTANQRDVGGSQGERGNVLSAHGGSPFDMTVQVDGISIAWIGPTSGSAWSTFNFNDSAAQEIAFETAAISAEASSGGVRVNVIPRDGGNAFHGSGFGNFATRGMSWSNYTPELKARGARAPAGFDKLWDESAGVGGPIRRDRLWFFYAHRYRGNDLIGTDAFYSLDPLAVVYTPDLTRPVHAGGWDMDNQLRLTTQVTPRNKTSIFIDKANKRYPVVVAVPTITGESATGPQYPQLFMGALTWQSTINSKLLWDAAISYNRQDSEVVPNEPSITAVAPVSVVEATTGRRLRAPFTAVSTYQHNYNSRAALSYVTGSHAAKVGFTLHTGVVSSVTNAFSDSWAFSLFNSVPQSVTLTTAPFTQLQNIDANLGIYAQDKWTLRRLTVTGGLRFDYFKNTIPAESAPAVRWVGARSFSGVSDVPNWKDLSPRLGVSYDLFGTGKTALKASVSRYVGMNIFGFANTIDPFATTVNTATRTWTDLNRNFIPEGNPLDPSPNGEFFGTINPNFGKSIITTQYDQNLSQGWGKRPYNWEYSGTLQHELLTRVSLEFSYFRRTFHNQTVVDNLDVTPADYDQFCIIAPTDSRLGAVSGTQICGLYDIKPPKAGVASNQIITFAKNYPGEANQTYNGVEFNMNARPTGRLFLQAGFAIGRTEVKNCALVDNPQTQRFCDVAPPVMGSYRVSGGYNLPWDVQVSGVFQSTPSDVFTPQAGGNTGLSALADYPARTADAIATLGRPIATPGGVITVPLLDPSTYSDFAERVNQVDLRVSKGVRIGRYRLDAIADFYNVFNSSAVLTFTTTYGPAWLTPATVLQSAFVKLGGRVTF